MICRNELVFYCSSIFKEELNHIRHMRSFVPFRPLKKNRTLIILMLRNADFYGFIVLTLISQLTNRLISACL